MYHLIIYRKADGAIERTIVKNEPCTASLTALGYNPVLYSSLKVISKEKIEPSGWQVQDGLLTPLYSKELKLIQQQSLDPRQREETARRIIFIGDSPTFNTGFGTQYRLLKEGFIKRGYIIEHLRYQEIEQLRDKQFDFVIALSDYGSVRKLFDLQLDNLIYWFALESPVWPEEWNENLEKVSHLVPLTRYGKRALEKKGLICKPIIPHGVDSEIFRPIPIRQRGLLRQQNNYNNKFIISYLGTNVERKRLDLLIASYAQFVKNHDTDRESRLLLKTKEKGFYDLKFLIQKEEERLSLTDLASHITIIEKEWSPHEVAQFINLSDLGFNTTAGEGFCVPVIEYLMCGIPFLAGRHTSFPELIGSNLSLISSEETYIDSRFHWQRYVIDVDHAELLLREYFLLWKKNHSYDRQKLRELALPYSSVRMVDLWDNLLSTLERQQIEHEYIMRAKSSLLQIEDSTEEQKIYEKATQAINNSLPNDSIQWIQVY